MEFIQTLILLAILYFLIPEKKKEEVIESTKKRVSSTLPKRSKIVEWTPVEDETSKTSKTLIKSLKDWKKVNG